MKISSFNRFSPEGSDGSERSADTVLHTNIGVKRCAKQAFALQDGAGTPSQSKRVFLRLNSVDVGCREETRFSRHLYGSSDLLAKTRTTRAAKEADAEAEAAEKKAIQEAASDAEVEGLGLLTDSDINDEYFEHEAEFNKSLEVFIEDPSTEDGDSPL